MNSDFDQFLTPKADTPTPTPAPMTREDPGFIQISARIPRALHRQIKLKLIHDDRDMVDVIIESLSRYVQG